MTYFKHNNKPLPFHLAGLDKDEYQEYKALVQAGGGEVSENSDKNFIIFTKRNLYRPGMYPHSAVYDVEFIKQCTHTGNFENPTKYSSLGGLKFSDIIPLIYFLDGCQSSKGRSACLTQSQESIIARSERIGDEVSSHSREPSLTPEFLSAENSDIPRIEQVIDDNETVLVRNPVVASPPVDESQVVVTKQDMRKCVPVMAGGDIAENDNERTNDTNEKCPCRLEYQRDVVPKMQQLAKQQRRDLERRRTEQPSLRETRNCRQQRSPRTITKRRRVMNGTQEEDYPIKIETLSDVEDSTTAENAECTSNAEDDSDDYTMIRISPKSEQRSHSQSSSDNEALAKKSRYLRVIPEAHQRFSSPSYFAEKKKRNENWIESKNFRKKTAMKNGREENHEEMNLIRPILVPNPNHTSTVSNLLHNRMKKRLSDEKNAERETRRTDLPVNMKKNEKRRNENFSAETLQEISNDYENPQRGRRLFNRKDDPLKMSSRVQKKSQMLDVCKRSVPTRIVQGKKSEQNNSTSIDFYESSTSNFSDSTDMEIILQEIVHRNSRKTKDDSSWNKPGPSGLANKQKNYNNNDEESRRANGPKKPFETGKRNSPRSNRMANDRMETSSESDDDDGFELQLRRRENSRKRSPNKASTVRRKVIQCRKPFSKNEKQKMIKYLIDKDEIDQAKGSKVWQRMIMDGYLPHRTWESLKNNMKRYILPSIEDFGLDEETLAKFVMTREKRK